MRPWREVLKATGIVMLALSSFWSESSFGRYCSLGKSYSIRSGEPLSSFRELSTPAASISRICARFVIMKLASSAPTRFGSREVWLWLDRCSIRLNSGRWT